jgi:hypothetical protein
MWLISRVDHGLDADRNCLRSNEFDFPEGQTKHGQPHRALTVRVEVCGCDLDAQETTRRVRDFKAHRAAK